MSKSQQTTPSEDLRAKAKDSAGEALQQALLAQADVLERRAKEELLEQIKRRIEAASKTPFGRMQDWMYCLDVTWRQRAVLARVYSFQNTKDKDGNPHEFRMSLATAAEALHIDRGELSRDLSCLTEKGYVLKRSNGRGKPFSYAVDVTACLNAAVKAGYREQWEETAG